LLKKWHVYLWTIKMIDNDKTRLISIHKEYEKIAFNYKGGNSILFDWEAGAWDAVPPPPAVHSPEYRNHVVEVLQGLAVAINRPSLISLGCGNAHTEVELHRAGFDVLATDLSDEAVGLAHQKGLRASKLDAMVTHPPLGDFDFAYADGLLGHLAVTDAGLERLMGVLGSVTSPTGMIVLIYELSDTDEECFHVTGHPAAKFYRPPAGRMAAKLLTFAPEWKEERIERITYTRPNRGIRHREILVLSRVSSALLVNERKEHDQVV